MAQKQQDLEAVAFKFEYVTSTVTAYKGDAVVIRIVNEGTSDGVAQTTIYKETGSDSIIVGDSGQLGVGPSQVWGMGFPVPDAGNYWLLIRVTSEFLIPKASFERSQSGTWVPFVYYHPGDFANIQLDPVRKRLW